MGQTGSWFAEDGQDHLGGGGQCILHLDLKDSGKKVRILGRAAPSLIDVGTLTLTWAWRINGQGCGLGRNAHVRVKKCAQEGRWKWCCRKETVLHRLSTVNQWPR